MVDSQAPGQGGMPGIRRLVQLFYRRKFTILLPALAMTGIAWAITSILVPRYAATAAITLNVSKVNLVDRELVSRLPLENSTLRSEIDVMRSRSLNDQVATSLALASDPEALREAAAWESPWPHISRRIRDRIARLLPGIVEKTPPEPPQLSAVQLTNWLVGNLGVANDGRSLTILISFTSDSPQLAANVANAVAQTYLDDQVLAKNRATMAASTWLGERVEQIRKELEASEAAVDDFRRKTGLLEVKGGSIPAERLADLNAQLGSARAERVRAEVELQVARQSRPETLPDDLASKPLQQFRQALREIKLQITALQDHGALYKIKGLQTQAAVLQTQMNAEMSHIIAGLATKVEAAAGKEKVLERSFQGMESQLGDASHSGVRLMQLQREADANRSIYETFLSRYKQASEQETLSVPDARLISRAEPPQDPVYPNMVRWLIVGAIGGLGVGGGLAFLRETLDRRVRQTAEVEVMTGVPVFGMLPRVSRWRGVQPQDYPLRDPHSPFGIALTRVQAALRAPKAPDHKQVILVTSAQPGEGKTSFCTGLARSLANSGMRVLVIDADPYRSRLAAAFGAAAARTRDTGAAEPVRLDALVRADTKSTARYIPAPSEDDLQRLIHSGQFAKLLEEARLTHDAVIIDTPPVMTSTNAALLGKFADKALLVVRWGRTSWDQMNAAVGFLRLCQVGLDGIVMVGAERGTAGYGQFSGYGYAGAEARSVRPTLDRESNTAEPTAGLPS